MGLTENKSLSKVYEKKKNNLESLLKMVILGDSGVGKTSILYRFCNDKFNDNYINTIGLEFISKNITVNNKSIKLKIVRNIENKK